MLRFHSRRGEEALATRALASQTNRNRAFPPPRVCVCVLMQQRFVGRARAPREECTLQECLRAHNGDHGEHSGAPAGAARSHFWHRALESALERESSPRSEVAARCADTINLTADFLGLGRDRHWLWRARQNNANTLLLYYKSVKTKS